MNIIVRTYSGKTVTRPDTTWKRGDDASYLPEFVNAVSYAPVIFARISKAGRSVGAKFADRYYDGIGFGVLLYAENLIDGSPEGFATASCLDHSSFLCYPVFSKETLGRGNVFKLAKDGKKLFSFNKAEAILLEEAICEATKFCYIRSGDFLVRELAERKPLLEGKEINCSIEGKYCDNSIIGFSLYL